MQIINRLRVLLFVVLASCGLISQLGAMDAQWSSSLDNVRSEALVNFLYKIYDQYKNDFVKFISADVSIKECKTVIAAKKQAIEQELALSSYKNVLFSSESLKNIGLMIAGEMGRSALNDLVTSYWQMNRWDRGPLAKLILSNQGSLSRGMYGLQVIAGFGLYKNIKAMRDRKQQLSEENEKCTKILELLNKAA